MTSLAVSGISDVANGQRTSLCRELADLGMRDAGEKGPRVQDRVQLGKVIDPERDPLQRSWSGRLLQPREGCRGLSWSHGQQRFQDVLLGRC